MAARPVPESVAEQLEWPVADNVTVNDRPHITFDQLPKNVRTLLSGRRRSRVATKGTKAAYETGTMQRFDKDTSSICADPEWREYWTRQGVLDSVCDTSNVLADILRRLRVSVENGHAVLDECNDARELVVSLYNDRVLLIRTIRDYQQERIRLLKRIEELTLYLKEVAREIQGSFPADMLRQRGLNKTDNWTHEQWMALFPVLHISVRKIIVELAECNARLNDSAGADPDFESLVAKLQRLSVEVTRAQRKASVAEQRLDTARDIIGALVKQTAAMGYSIRAIDQAFDEESNEEGVRAFIEGVKRYDFAAQDVPDAVEPFDAAALQEAVENARSRVERLRAECKGRLAPNMTKGTRSRK